MGFANLSGVSPVGCYKCGGHFAAQDKIIMRIASVDEHGGNVVIEIGHKNCGGQQEEEDE